jgi:pyroglutamyl-peptidase
MYQTIHLTKNKYPKIKAGFMHIPYIPEQVVNRPNMPSMSLERIVKGITASLQAIIDYGDRKDILSIGGSLH